MDFLGVGGGELLVIATIALIVVGPKDLPVLLRKLGQFTARMRGMAAEFRASFDEMARQTELEELRKEIEGLKNNRLTEDLDATRADVEGAFRTIDEDLAAPGVSGMAPLAPHLGETAAEVVADEDAFGGPEPQPEVASEESVAAPREHDERLA
jgi:sec-independent protein translocase protein TatB